VNLFELFERRRVFTDRLAGMKTEIDDAREELARLENRSDDGAQERSRRRTKQITNLLAEMADIRKSIAKIDEQSSRAVQRGLRVGSLRSEVGEDTGAGLEFMQRAPDPWNEPVRTADTTELRSRALTAVERTGASDRSLEQIERMFTDGDDQFDFGARYVTAVSNPAYATAFRRVARDPMHGAALWTNEEREAFRQVDSLRALGETGAPVFGSSGGSGGYMLPFSLDPKLQLVNTGATNPVRDIAQVRTITSNALHMVSTAGVNAEWLAEASEVS
jgi:hypothetical protein